MYDTLIATISNFVQLQNKEYNVVESLFRPCSVKKDTVLIEKGSFSNFAFHQLAL